MEEEAAHTLLLLMDMMHRKSWSYTLRLWEKSGDSEGSKEFQGIATNPWT